MLKKFFAGLAVLFFVFMSFDEGAQAATIIDKSQVYMYEGEVWKYTRSLYLPEGGRLGIYVQEYEDPENAFHWMLRNSSGKEVDWGSVNTNKVIDMPVGTYYLQLSCGPKNCRGNGVLSVQQ